MISKLVGMLLNPVVILLMLLAAYLILRPKSVQRRISGVSFVVLFIFFTNSFISNEVLLWWEIKGLLYTEIEPQKYKVAIVLGGVTNSSQVPTDRVHINSGADRLLHAISLYKKGLVKRILVCGGSGRIVQEEISEADRMYNFLVEYGVPKRHILREDNSRNTYENARNAQSILLNNNLNGPYILVTSAYHMRRAKACFNANEMEVLAFSTSFESSPPPYTLDYYLIPDIAPLQNWQRLFKEWAGMLAYWVKGYI